MKVIDNNAKISMKNMKKSEETYNDSDVVCENWQEHTGTIVIFSNDKKQILIKI